LHQLTWEPKVARKVEIAGGLIHQLHEILLRQGRNPEPGRETQAQGCRPNAQQQDASAILYRGSQAKAHEPQQKQRGGQHGGDIVRGHQCPIDQGQGQRA